MNTTEKLFADFAPVSKEQWKAKVIEDLKGADFDKKLVWKTDDGFTVQPFYTAEDVQAASAPYEISLPAARQWVNYVEIDVDNVVNANARALRMKKLGATGFLFRTGDASAINFDILLKDLEPWKNEISFSLEKPSLSILPGYFDYLQKNRIIARNVKGFVESDILENWSRKGIEPDFATLTELVKCSKAFPNFKCLAIRSHAFVNAGANTTQELAFTFNKLADYIDRLTAAGIPVADVTDEIMLHLAIGGDYFFEIAKLRAARVLLNNIFALYNADGSKVRIVSSNSSWSKSFYDPNVNLLRNTSEAMSALLGGCDALLTIPHDVTYQQAGEFSHRIALNVANLLKEESYFDKVTDPAAGSYYIENLTRSLTDHALALFRQIEQQGGYISAFKAGSIQQQIASVRDRKEKEIASRRRVYVGSNKYPNQQEKAALKNEGKKDSKNGLPLLPEQRATRSFEELRSRTLAHFEKTGYIPRVYLACFGNLAMRKARATFAGEFFGTAGFEILGEFFFSDFREAAIDSAKSEADIIVICSSDQDYETGAAEFARSFKSLASHKTLVLAGYPETIVEELKNAGVDTFIHIKSNAIEVLGAFQQKLLS